MDAGPTTSFALQTSTGFNNFGQYCMALNPVSLLVHQINSTLKPRKKAPPQKLTKSHVITVYILRNSYRFLSSYEMT